MTATARAQEAPVLREAPGVEDIRQILLASYPELREGRVSWRVTASAAGLVIEAHRVETPFVPLPPASVALVSAAAVVDAQGALDALVTGGTVLEALRAQAAAIVVARPRDVDQTLKEVRAKYAPSDAEKAATLLPLGLQAVLKTSPTRAHTFRSDAPAEKASEALTWQIEVDGADARVFTLVFEPIDGRLMSVVRR